MLFEHLLGACFESPFMDLTYCKQLALKLSDLAHSVLERAIRDRAAPAMLPLSDSSIMCTLASFSRVARAIVGYCQYLVGASRRIVFQVALDICFVWFSNISCGEYVEQ